MEMISKLILFTFLKDQIIYKGVDQEMTVAIKGENQLIPATENLENTIRILNL